MAVVLLLVAAGLAVVLGWQQLNRPLSLESTEYYEIAPGTSMAAIAAGLAERGILSHPRLFGWWGRLTGDAARIKAGEYEIQPGINPRQLLDKLVSGEVRQYQLTLVEGWTFQQALAVIQASPGISSTLTGLEPADMAASLGTSHASPEGLLFPDTYFYTRGTRDQEILQRAYQRLVTMLDNEWQARAAALPFATAYEALILASIVEKETGLGSEREQIAGVFIRRLQQGMRLQSDPTVIYGLGDQFDGNLSRASLDQVTPYNTYRVGGLPPTPIALASRESIRASLNPDNSNNLYFVSRGDGSHQFSATLDEHNTAVRQFQLGIPQAPENQ